MLIPKNSKQRDGQIDRQTNGQINQESESAECGVQLSLAGQSVMDVNSYVSRLRENLDTFVCLSFCVSVFLCVCLSVYLSVCLFWSVF